jgi:hypothetical protein
LESKYIINASTIIIIKIIFASFDKIQKVGQFWEWSINELAPKMKIQTWYNSNPTNLGSKFIGDYQSMLIGYAIIRQNRVKPSKFSVFNFYLKQSY